MQSLESTFLAMLVMFASTLYGQDKTTYHDETNLDHEIDSYVRAEAEAKRFSGVVLIAKDGISLVRRAYGYLDATLSEPNTPETAFMIYSNTKQFTAASILLLRDRSRLSVTDPVGKYLSDCPPEWESVTLHHLLTHTSGIEIDNLWWWLYDHYPSYREGPQLGRYEQRPLVSKPGEKFQYSNGGYMLLAQVVAKVSGKDFQQFLETDLFKVLGMKHSGCDRDRLSPGRARGHELSGEDIGISEQATRGIVGAGDVYSTVDDLLIWDESLYTDKLLSDESREAMFGIQVKSPRGGIGYGWFIRNGSDGSISHFQHGGSGTGFTSVLIRRPKDHVYIAILSNIGSETEFKLGDGCRERLDAWLATTQGK